MSDTPDTELDERPYERPEIEAVLTPEELIREIHYAGVGTLIG
jgi:hypothetical protein